MKKILVSFVLVAVACSSGNLQSKKQFEYSQIQFLKIGSTTAKNVIDIFGPPSSSEIENGSDCMRYLDPRDDYQRLTLYFDSSTHKLRSILWIPRPNEKESSVEYAKGLFQDSKFSKNIFGPENPHSSPNEFILRDANAGISIVYSRAKEGDYVDLIAFDDANQRVPTSIDAPKKVSFSIGDITVTK